MGLIDTHAHYHDPRFDGDRDEILSRLGEPSEYCPAGVEAVVEQGCDLATSRVAADLADRFPRVYAAVGVHPEDCLTWTEDTPDELRALLDRPKVVALGEIGLDRHWEGPECPWETQKRVFLAQMELARETGYPVCVHDREAHGEIFEIIRSFPGVVGVMHAYSGSGEMARQLVRLGWTIGFGGTLTFKNARNVREVAKVVPLDRVVVETDCPYLAPEPWRGTRNDSRKAWAVAAALAEIHGVTPEKMTEITGENARRFYRMLQK